MASRTGARPIPDYALYGLTVAVDAPMGGLRAAAAGSAPDVRLHLQAAPPWSDRPMAEGGQIYRVDAAEADAPAVDVAWLEGRAGLRMRYADGTTFHVRADAREVWATWAAPLTLEDTAVYFVGPVLGYVLRRLGVLSLHASAVAIDGRAVAFGGDPGAGKSTTAAAFSTHGFAALTDDVLALRDRDGAVLAYPAYDHLRLWPHAARMLAGDEDRLSWLTPTWPKRAFPLAAFGAGLAADPLPLGAIFLLSPREDAATAPRVEPARGVDALLQLVTQTSANYLLDPAMRAAELTMLSRLMAAVPLFRLTPHADPARLPALLDVVLDTVRR